MCKLNAVIAVPLLLLLLCAPSVLASEDAGESSYRLDPALTLSAVPPALLAAEPPVTIRADEHATKVLINSAAPLAPYVGAGRAAELSLAELLLLPDQQEGGGVNDYQVEAGIGLHLEDKASLNLGYRFNELPELFGDRNNDPLTLTGDLRISFDVKMAF
jgi:hypothetical protein